MSPADTFVLLAPRQNTCGACGMSETEQMVVAGLIIGGMVACLLLPLVLWWIERRRP